jgi:hypothetical protein
MNCNVIATPGGARSNEKDHGCQTWQIDIGAWQRFVK